VSTYVENVDVERLRLKRGDEILDVGCGDGHLARSLVEAGYRVTGVEPSARLRAAFEEAAADLDTTAYAVVAGYAEQLPFADGRWRAAVMTEVLEHVENPATVLAELNRVVAPGGVICVSVPTSRTERLYSHLHPRYLANATHRTVFTREGLSELLGRAGFRIVHVEGRNFIPAVLWVFHAALRSEADHTGAILQHLWVNRAVELAMAVLQRLRLLRFVIDGGNRVFPKSWYFYAEKVTL
jgi:SAM-dependent methyltransferase